MFGGFRELMQSNFAINPVQSQEEEAHQENKLTYADIRDALVGLFNEAQSAPDCLVCSKEQAEAFLWWEDWVYWVRDIKRRRKNRKLDRKYFREYGAYLSGNETRQLRKIRKRIKNNSIWYVGVLTSKEKTVL